MRRVRKTETAAGLPADPLLSQLTRIQGQAKQLGFASRRDPVGTRGEVLVTLADLNLLIDALHSARGGLQHPLDANLAVSRVISAYRRADALS